jgi:transcriptional regulator with XRE-family HTH domain
VEKEKRKVTLKVLRAINGKTQSDISDCLKRLGRNIEQSHVSLWERGIQTPTIEVAIDLAIAYDVSFLELVKALGFEPDRVTCKQEEHAN